MTTDQIKLQLAQHEGLRPDQASLEVEKGYDSTGDEAVWVWVTLQHWPEFAVRQQLREEVNEQVRDWEKVDFVYVRFRDASELVPAP